MQTGVTMTSKDAIAELAKMLETVSGMQKIKGQAPLLRKVRSSMDYISRYKVDGSNIPGLMVAECSREVDELNKLIGERQQELKGMPK